MTETSSPLWLSHHHPENHERCVHVGHALLCRRCVVLYPTTVVVTLAMTVAGALTGPLASLAVVLFAAPFLVDWVAEHAGTIIYSPKRQIAVTVPAGIAGGIALGAHLERTLDPWVSVPVAACAAVALVSALSSTLPADAGQSVGQLARGSTTGSNASERPDPVTVNGSSVAHVQGNSNVANESSARNAVTERFERDEAIREQRLRALLADYEDSAHSGRKSREQGERRQETIHL